MRITDVALDEKALAESSHPWWLKELVERVDLLHPEPRQRISLPHLIALLQQWQRATATMQAAQRTRRETEREIEHEIEELRALHCRYGPGDSAELVQHNLDGGRGDSGGAGTGSSSIANGELSSAMQGATLGETQLRFCLSGGLPQGLAQAGEAERVDAATAASTFSLTSRGNVGDHVGAKAPARGPISTRPFAVSPTNFRVDNLSSLPFCLPPAPPGSSLSQPSSSASVHRPAASPHQLPIVVPVAARPPSVAPFVSSSAAGEAAALRQGEGGLEVEGGAVCLGEGINVGCVLSSQSASLGTGVGSGSLAGLGTSVGSGSLAGSCASSHSEFERILQHSAAAPASLAASAAALEPPAAPKLAAATTSAAPFAPFCILAPEVSMPVLMLRELDTVEPVLGPRDCGSSPAHPASGVQRIKSGGVMQFIVQDDGLGTAPAFRLERDRGYS